MFGISADNTPSQAEFAKQLKLAFPLLSDFGRREVIAKYGVLWPDRGYANRATFVVDTEGKIAYARQFFNDAVMTVNMAVQQFPGNLVAGAFGFEERAYFEIEASATEPVTVSL